MTDQDLTLPYDLGPIGLSSYRENLDGLTRRYRNPRDGDSKIISEEEILFLTDEIADLRKVSNRWYMEQVPMYDYLISLKADKNQAIGQSIRSRSFWKAIPGNKQLIEGDTFEKLYSLRDDLKEEIQCYTNESVKKELRRLNEALDNIGYDVKLLADGHYDKALSTYIHESWVADEFTSANVRLVDSPTQPSTTRWGDVSSSDEDDLLASAVKSLTTYKDSKNPGIDLPGDFDQCFPLLGRTIDKLCNHWSWEKRYEPSIKLKNQGLVPFRENPDGTIECSLENNERLALLSLYASIGALFLKPQTLAREDSTEVALTYVCSVIAREKLAKDEDKELLKIALKNGDGGKTVLSNRLHFLTKTGSSGIKMIFNSLEKLVSKFARELKDDQIDAETSKAITDRAFTSIDGMLGNCYRKSKKPIYENRVVAGKRSRQPIKVGEKQIVSLPDLSTSRVPLKSMELTKANALRAKFNDRKTIVEKRLSSVASPTIFDAPKICKEVVAEAYQKLQPYKTILRSRMMRIREVATIENNGAKPTPGNWATGTTKVLSQTEDISEETWSFLTWEELE